MKAPLLTELESKQVKKFIETVKKELGSSFIKAVLFGSRARGEGDENSDVDILLLVDNIDTAAKYRIWDTAYDIFLNTGIDISPLVTTREKFEKWRSLERLFPKQIEAEGIPL